MKLEALDFQFYEDLIDFLTHHYTLPRKKSKAIGLRVNKIGENNAPLILQNGIVMAPGDNNNRNNTACWFIEHQ